MWNLAPEQRLRCPEDFQARITAAGGVNCYDEPNFRVTWGQTETIRGGGVWDVPGLEGIQHYRGYRDVLADGGEACWNLMQWMPPEFWGTPAAWYMAGYDMSCGLQVLGEYPYRGRYLTIFPMKDMPLSSFIVDLLIPIVIWSKQITEEQKKAVIAERKARSEEAQVSQIEDSLRNAFPALGEIRSAAGLSCLSVVQKKVEQIERHWASGIEFVKQRGKGLSIN